MKLIPKQPPGRITRKARSFEADILQLRGQGYTLEAIREALANVGVEVSISTVRREACRQPTTPAPQQAAALASEPRGVTAPLDASAKDVAEAFARRHHTNPLFHPKERP